jgi:hypothetical protein
VDVKIEKGKLILKLAIEAPKPSLTGLPRFVAGTARVRRTKLRVAGSEICLVAYAFICPGNETTPWARTVAAEVISPKMRAARKALEERKAGIRGRVELKEGEQ